MSITLHLTLHFTSIINICYSKLTKFEVFVRCYAAFIYSIYTKVFVCVGCGEEVRH